MSSGDPCAVGQGSLFDSRFRLRLWGKTEYNRCANRPFRSSLPEDKPQNRRAIGLLVCGGDILCTLSLGLPLCPTDFCPQPTNRIAEHATHNNFGDFTMPFFHSGFKSSMTRSWSMYSTLLLMSLLVFVLGACTPIVQTLPEAIEAPTSEPVGEEVSSEVEIRVRKHRPAVGGSGVGAGCTQHSGGWVGNGGRTHGVDRH